MTYPWHLKAAAKAHPGSPSLWATEHPELEQTWRQQEAAPVCRHGYLLRRLTEPVSQALRNLLEEPGAGVPVRRRVAWSVGDAQLDVSRIPPELVYCLRIRQLVSGTRDPNATH